VGSPVRAALASAALCFLAGCALQETIGGSREEAAAWAASRGFHAGSVSAEGFDLFSLLRRRAAAGRLTVYIEGDGAPWPSAARPPADPTPRRPVALLLAGRDPSPRVAYLGRPCQYLGEAERAKCGMAYWSSRRYVQRVVDAMDAAVTRLKEASGAGSVRLVGHSGGGVIAALLAQRRNDVDSLVTLAAPLSLAAWTARHGLSPLEAALDPMRMVAGRLPPAVHFAGEADEVVPPDIVAAFVQRHGGRLETLAGFDHDCCWARSWPELLQRARSQEGSP
jgi:pimeloyl-ACP methyl ester carboxylesterase